MKTVDVAEFEEQCLALLDGLGPDGLVITRRGKPVARLVPFERSHAGPIGSLHDKVKIRGDILSTGETWNARAESSPPCRLRKLR